MTEVKKATEVVASLRDRVVVVLSTTRPAAAASSAAHLEHLRVLEAIEKEATDAAAPLLAKLVAKASLPEDRRLLNEKTCAAILALNVEFKDCVITPLITAIGRCRESLAAAEMTERAAALQESQRLERLALEHAEDAARSKGDHEWAAATDALMKHFRERRDAIRKFLKRVAHHGAKASSSNNMAPSTESKVAFAKAHRDVEVGVALLTEAEQQRVEVEAECLDGIDEIEADEENMWMAIIVAANESVMERLSDVGVSRIDHSGESSSRQWISNVFVAEPTIFSVGSSWLIRAAAGPKVTLIPAPPVDDAAGSEVVGAVEMFEVSVSLVFRTPIGASQQPSVGDVLVVPPETAARQFESRGGGGKKKRKPAALAPATTSSDLIAVICGHGGYFAAIIVDVHDPTTPIHHKTFARYITRRGQGGRQSAHNGRTDTAGSQLRATMEKKWIEECQALLAGWRDSGKLSECRAIFVHAPGAQNHAMICGKSSPLGSPEWGDRLPPIMSLPVPSGRPTLTEAVRCASLLLSGVKTNQSV